VKFIVVGSLIVVFTEVYGYATMITEIEKEVRKR
jgi:hypothetical protein